jgi:hypothetical protein
MAQTGPDQRQSPRHPGGRDTACEVIDSTEGRRFQAWVRDISTSGICLLLAPRFEANTLLTVILQNEQTGFTRQLGVRVCHADICCPNDAWLHGCSFLESVTAGDLWQLGCLEDE